MGDVVLSKSAKSAYAEYAVRDYNKSMGVVTYKSALIILNHFRISA